MIFKVSRSLKICTDEIRPAKKRLEEEIAYVGKWIDTLKKHAKNLHAKLEDREKKLIKEAK